MAKNIAGYISNLGKSIGYSAVDRVSKMAPNTAEFVESNSELFKEVSNSIRDYKNTFKRTKNVVKTSKVYEAGDVLMTSVFEDLKTGKFYNKKRVDEMSIKAMGSLGDMSMDDVDMGSWDDTSDDINNWEDDQDNDKVSSAIKRATQYNAEMVSDTIARTGQYLAETQKTSTNILYAQNTHAFSLFNRNLQAINSNISNIVKFSSETLQTHAENSKKYFEENTKLMQDQTALLRQIAESVSTKTDNKEEKKRTSYDDIVGANGTPNLKTYASMIKKNFGNKFSSIASMNSSMGEDSNLLLAFAANPLSFIPNAVVDKAISKSVKDASERLDKSIGGLFGSIIAKFNDMASDNNDNLITKTIGELLGVKAPRKTTLEGANYTKGKVEWTGKSDRTLNVVLPTYLRKIVSLLSGKGEMVYDYEKGSFIDANDISKEFKKMKDSYASSATSEMNEMFKQFMTQLRFNSLEERKSLEKDMNQFFKSLYEKGGYFNVNGKDDLDYMNYGISEKNYKVIKSMFKNSPRGMQLGINNEILSQRNRQTRDMNNLEADSSSIYHYLFNDSKIDEFIKRNKDGKITDSMSLTGNLAKSVDDKGQNVFYYLQNIYKELSYIRQYGPNAGSSSRTVNYNAYGQPISRPSINDIEIKDIAKRERSHIERNQQQNENFLAKQTRRKEKQKGDGYLYTNIDDIDEDKIESFTSASFQIYNAKKEQELREQRAEQSLTNRLLGATSIAEKTKVLGDKISNITSKPMETVAKIIDKVDIRLYEAIYGKEKGKEGPSGFLNQIIFQIKKTFTNLNTWIDEKILMPIKKKLEIQSFKDIGKKVLGVFGIDADDLKKKVRTYLFGDKETGEKGLFTDIKTGIKDTFKGAFDYAKDSLKTVYGPVFSKIKESMPKSKEKSKNETEETNESVIPYIESNTTSMNEVINHFSNNNAKYEYYKKKEAEGYFKDMTPAKQKQYKEYLTISKRMKKQEEYNTNISTRDYYKNDYMNKLNNLIGFSNEGNSDLVSNAFDKMLVDTKGNYEGASIEGLLSTLLQLDKKDVRYGEIYKKINAYKNKNFNAENVNTLSKVLQLGSKDTNTKKTYDRLSAFTNPEAQQKLDFVENSIDNTNKNIVKDTTGILGVLKDIRGALYKALGLGSAKEDGKKIFTDSKGKWKSLLSNTKGTQLGDEYGVVGDLSSKIANVIAENTEHHAEGGIAGDNKGGYVKDNVMSTLHSGEFVMTTKNVDKALDTFKSFVELSKMQVKSGIKKITGKDPSQIKDKVGEVISDEVKPMAVQVAEEYKQGFDKTRRVLFGDPDENAKKFGEVVSDATKNISKYAPGMVGAGLLGGGLSLITGAVGGPLLGAAVGAGISLTKDSDKMKELLFGEVAENGDRKGGMISAKTQKALKKFLPDMGKFGVAGGITALLPFLPFGPVGGVLLGSAIGFAKNTDTVKERLYGDSGLLSGKNRDKIKKVAPRALATMIPSLFMGPFGIMGNAVLGAGLGILSTNNKFNDAIFGTPSKVTGKNENGLLPTVRDHVVNPIQKFFAKVSNNFFDWMEEKVMKPVESAIQPIGKQIEVMFKSVIGGIGKSVDKMFEDSVGVPLSKMVDGLVKKVNGFFGKIFKLILAPAKFAISTPFKMVGALGNKLRARQIRKGNADYMSAEERNEFRQKHYSGVMGKYRKVRDMKSIFNNDRFGNFDSFLEDQDEDSLNEIGGYLNTISNTSKNVSNRRQELRDNMGREVSAYMDHYGSFHSIGRKGAKDVMAAINNGDHESAANMIANQRDKRRNSDSKMLDKINEFAKNKQNGNDPSVKKAMDYISKRIDDPKAIRKMHKLLKEGNYDEVMNIFKKKMDEDDGQQERLLDFLAKNGDEYAKLRNAGSFTKDQVDAAYKKLGKYKEFRGIDRNSIEKYLNLINKEKGFRAAQHETEKTVEFNEDGSMGEVSETIKEATEEVNKKQEKRHEKIVNLFESTIKKLSEIENIGRYSNGEISGKQFSENVDIEEFLPENANKGFKHSHSRKKYAKKMSRLENTVSNITGDEKKQIDAENTAARKVGVDPETVPGYALGGTVKRTGISKLTKGELVIPSNTVKAIPNAIIESDRNEETRHEELISTIKRLSDKNTSAKLTKITDSGKIIKFIQNSKGETEPDLADKQTKDAIAEYEDNKATQKGILGKLGSFASNAKNFVADKLNIGKNKDEDKPSFLSKIGSFLGKGALGVAGLAGLGFLAPILKDVAPVMGKFWNDTISPWIHKTALPWIENTALPTIGNLVEKGLPLIVGGVSKAIHWALTDGMPLIVKAIGDSIKFAVTDVVPSIYKAVTGAVGLSGKDGEESLPGNLAYATARDVATGTNRFEKLGQKFAGNSAKVGEEAAKDAAKAGTKSAFSTAKDFIFHPMTSTVKATFKTGTKVGTGIFAKGINLASKPMGKLASAVNAKELRLLGGNSLNGLSTKVSEKGTKVSEGISKTFKDKAAKYSEKVIEKNTAVKGVEKVAESGAAKSIMERLPKFFENIFTNGIVKKLIGEDTCAAIMNKFVPALLNTAAKNIEKAGMVATAKVAASISTFGVATALFAFNDFIDGYNKACVNLGVYESDVNFGDKLLSGLINALLGFGLITTLIPEKVVYDLAIDILFPVLGIDAKSLKDKQDKLQKDLDDYNKKNGTSLSKQQLLNKKGQGLSLGEKLANTAPGKFVTKLFTNTGGTKADAAKSQSDMLNGTKNATEEVNKPWYEKVWGAVKDGFKASGKAFGMGGMEIKKGTKQYRNSMKVFKQTKGKMVGIGGDDIPFNSPAFKKIAKLNDKKVDKNALKKFGIGGGLTKDQLRNQNLTAFEPVTADQLNDWIRQQNASSPFVGHGDIFLEASKESGLDPRYIVAHAAVESGWGTSQISRDKNNYFGIGAFNDSPYASAQKFGSGLEQGIVGGAEWIRKNFTDAGQNTLSLMVNSKTHAYAVNNDGTPNQDWVNSISSIMSTAPGLGKYVPGSNGNLTSSSGNGEDPSQTSEDTKPSLLTFFDDLGSMMSNSLNRIYGFDTTSTSTSGGDSSGMLKGVDATSKTISNDWWAKTMGSAPVTSPFGPRASGMHTGIDYGVPEGTTIESPVNGTVVENTSRGNTSYGNFLEIKDNAGGQHIFGHMKQLSPLKVGTKVKIGEVIGESGNTGNSTGPHLHYETRNTSGNAVNPNDYLATLYSKAGIQRARVDSKIERLESNLGGARTGGDDVPIMPASKTEQLIGTIIKILMKIVDNTNNLSQIVELISTSSNIKIDENKLKELKTSKQPSSISNSISNQSSNLNTDDVKGLIELLGRIASE